MNKRNHLILPYCPFCGVYKGVGACRVKECPGSNPRNLLAEDVPFTSKIDEGVCIVCGDAGETRCSICHGAYCREHSSGWERVTLVMKDQRMGTCTRCGKTTCENCWILDSKGRIMCLQHLEKD